MLSGVPESRARIYRIWFTVSTNNRNDPLDSDWISQAEAARLRRVSRQAIARLIQRGRLQTLTIGGYVLVRRSDVIDFTPRSAGRPRKGTRDSRD